MDSTRNYFVESVDLMRKELDAQELLAEKKYNWLRSKRYLLEWELQRHFQSVDGVLSRCPGVELDDTCEDILARNPAARPGLYQLTGTTG